HVVQELGALFADAGARIGHVHVRVEARRGVQAGHADTLEPLLLGLAVGQFQVLVDAGEERRVDLAALGRLRRRLVLGVARFFAHGVASWVDPWIVLRAATVCTSLSPRPDRLQSTIASEGIPRASSIASAIAWLDSSAGRMPSQ